MALKIFLVNAVSEGLTSSGLEISHKRAFVLGKLFLNVCMGKNWPFFLVMICIEEVTVDCYIP
jgi:hypothetical protein